MTSYGSAAGDVLYLIVCAAPPARQTPSFVRRLRDRGWDTCVVLTPSAIGWVDGDQIAAVSGHPVRSEFRGADDPPFAPLGDAVLVAPATFNTINQCAAGTNDNLALGLMNEALGRGIPMSVVPWVNDALAAHPAYKDSLTLLESVGVRVTTPEPGESFETVALAAVGHAPRPEGSEG